VGVIVEILSLVPSLLLVQLFRRIRSRDADKKTSASALQETLKKMRSSDASAMSMPETGETSEPPAKTLKSKKEKEKWTCPWWCLFIAYGLSLLLAAVSIFFTIVRGIEFGDEKTQQWLTSLIVGFFSSILLLQPIKVSVF
jgi:hypothetical protein